MEFWVQLLEKGIRALGPLDVKPTDPLIGVSISQQQCYFFKNNRCLRRFPVSTSSNPPSEAENSFGTPRGWHMIAEKIGDGAPLGMVFKGRQPTGILHHQCPPEDQQKNLITTRILRLKGCEPGRNSGPGVDSFYRYIYLHGTNHEDRIGSPFSGGCVEFSNADIPDLYERTPPGTLVYIDD
jgi:hypothetical protein